MYNLNTAEKILVGENLTLLVYDKNQIIKSSQRGVAPLMQLINSGKSLKGYTAVDKVVGKAAAFLYCILKVERVHALILSEGAKQVFEEFKIEFSFNTLTDYVINRKGNGKCPMETAVEFCKNQFDALEAINKTLEKLQG